MLAGIIAALIAQGMSPFDATCAGAWLHAAAARPGRSLVAEDLLDGLVSLIRG